MMTKDYSFLDKLDRGMYFSKKEYEGEKLYTYDEVKDKLPSPFYSDHDLWKECYEYALSVLYRNTHQPKEGSGFVSPFVDAAFNKDIFLWDTCFISMFCNLIHKYIPGICSLDNFYAKQFEDGEIPREMVRDSGKDFLFWVNAYNSPLYSFFHNHYKFRGLSLMKDVPYEDLYKPKLGRKVEKNPYLTLDNLNHPILAFAEWESYKQTGDIKRLDMVFEPLYQYYQSLRYHIRHSSWLYVTDWASMDNSVRNKNLHLAVDTSSEMVLFANHLIKMIETLCKAGFEVKDKDERLKGLKEDKERTKDAINTLCWDENTKFYYDIDQNGNKIMIKTAAAFWTIIADVADEYRLECLSEYLCDEKTFKRTHRVPSLAADEEGYDPNGDYWNGSVWAPLNAMITLGLEERGCYSLSREIALNDVASIASVFKDTGTIWENYPADYLTKGNSDHPDMVGWSGLAPILFFIRYAVGLEADMGNIVWHLDLKELEKGPIGCLRYSWWGKEASFKAEIVNGLVSITVESSDSFVLKVLADGREKSYQIDGVKKVFTLEE